MHLVPKYITSLISIRGATAKEKMRLEQHNITNALRLKEVSIPINARKRCINADASLNSFALMLRWCACCDCDSEIADDCLMLKPNKRHVMMMINMFSLQIRFIMNN